MLQVKSLQKKQRNFNAKSQWRKGFGSLRLSSHCVEPEFSPIEVQFARKGCQDAKPLSLCGLRDFALKQTCLVAARPR